MATLILQAREVRAALDEKLLHQASTFKQKKGFAPGLATVLVGEDAASKIYIQKKSEACRHFGFDHIHHHLPSTTSIDELKKLIGQLNKDPSVHAVLIQKPLPIHLATAPVFEWIDPLKDVDCFNPFNIGKLMLGKSSLQPCTPAGIIEMLKYFKLPLAGKNALVIGRSEIVGKPLALLLLQQDTSVTIAHSKTSNLAEHIQIADFVFAAVGKPRFLNAELPWKKSATVIDVGINRLQNGKIVGDVDFENVQKQVAAITPVPGGIGPMTIAMLMRNTLICANLQHSVPFEAS